MCIGPPYGHRPARSIAGGEDCRPGGKILPRLERQGAFGDDAAVRDLYFAYGSNLSQRRLAERIPGPECQGPARLADYRLSFNKHSADGSGKANLVASPGEEAWGVLWTIAREDWPTLDGFEPGYVRTPCSAVDAAGQPRAASVYLWPGAGPEEAPYDWYLAYLLEGARENQLPAEYVRRLAAVRSRPDPSRRG